MTAAPVTRRRRSRFGYRPALDGVRGTAMVMFMAFHFGATWLPGAWVGINLFFVLSAFLITRLLVEERVRFGAIAVLSFYRRRARRLLPALFLLLATLTAYGLTVADPLVRRPMRSDLLATLFYVQNWHLIAADDQYFAAFDPSYLRHAWTLSVEEQFYVLVPLVLALLFAWRRSRRSKVAVVLVAGALSAGWTAVIGVASPAAQSHVYYGTDTRAQALCIGVALGLWMAPDGRGRLPRPLPRVALAVLGWGGLAALCFAYLRIEPFTPWMFDRGGMYLFALASAALILACADARPAALTRVLGWRPFAWLGRLSYSLYLWHWPVRLWLQRAAPDLPATVTFVIGMAATIAISAVSYRWLERPVMRGGLRELLRRPRTRRGMRPVVAAATAVLVGGAVAVGSVPSSVAAADTAARQAVPLVDSQPPYRPGDHTIHVAMVGDSMPDFLLQRYPQALYSDLRMTDLGVPGCDLMDLPLGMSKSARSMQNGKDCSDLKATLTSRLRASRADVLVIFWGSLVAAPHRLPGGRTVNLADASYRSRVRAALNTVARKAHRAGVRQIQLVTLPCRNASDPNLSEDLRQMISGTPKHIVHEMFDPVRTNRLMTRWARSHGDPVIDMYGQLCDDGFRPTVHGIRLYDDGVHFGAKASAMIWTWLAPTIRDTYRHRSASSAGDAS